MGDEDKQGVGNRLPEGADLSGGNKAGELFEEIKIIGCSKGNTRLLVPDNYQWIASFYFTLSPSPNEEWIQTFAQVRAEHNRQALSPGHPVTRVDARGIVISCRPDELQSHYDDLKADVATTNQKYRELLERSARSGDLPRLIDSAMDEALAKLKL